MTRSRILTIILSTALLLAMISVLPSVFRSVNLPGNHRGYEPEQPMPYSHRLHAGELGIDCRYCHFGAERAGSAGVPPMNVCMNCHQHVTATLVDVRAEEKRAEAERRPPKRVISPRLATLYGALGLDATLRRRSDAQPEPLRWKRVHELPDFVFFNHRAHVQAGVQCQDCHGAVQTMERVRQVSDLSMGWCVNCHRDSNAQGLRGKTVNAPVDCAGCHY